jgi:F420-dependent methylenetetrahydromethanopterin dehydrogenase
MQIDKSFVIEHLRETGQNDKVQHALDELPEKIDHDEHAQLLEKVGIDPGQLAEKAAKSGLSSL